jgi:hypothetical protein
MDYNNNKRWLKPLASAVSLILVSLPSYAVMKPLDDHSLRDATGQAAFYTTYIAPPSGLTGSGTNTSDFGFFKLGLNATIQLNANIDHLQLGCGGVKGPGCDIDINNVGLSGLAPATSTTRQSTDAVLTNPFIQLAIKNPTSLSTRQLVGFNLGAQKADGMLTFGTANDGTLNGINSLSGYLEVKNQTGQATVNPDTFTQTDTGIALKGLACDSYFGSCGLIKTTYTSTSYTLTLTPSGTTTINLPTQSISGSRISSKDLTASAIINGLSLSGPISANTGIGIPLSGQAAGTLNNLNVDVTIHENLGLVHSANLNGSPVALSLQNQQIQWPGAKSVAETGWWLELSNPIDIGNVTPNKNVDIPLATVKDSLAIVNTYLSTYYVKCGPFTISCLAGNIDVGTINLPNTANHAPLSLTDLTLINQKFSPNCYGSLKFC